MRVRTISRCWKDLGLIGLVQAGMLFLVPADANFPLNDDWAYAQMVRELLSSGSLTTSDWATAAAVFPSYWGALFCLPLGFSHTALRLSTLTLGCLGVAAFYGLLRELGIDARRSVAGAMLLLVNPLYLNLSYTFMTDVPFCALAVLALWLYLRGLRGETASLWLASVAVAAALLCRQLGLALCAAPVLALWTRRHERSLRMRDIAAAVALPLAVAFGYTWWLFFRHDAPLAVAIRLRELRDFYADAAWVGTVLERFTGSLLYFGWFVAPLVCAGSWGLRPGHCERPGTHRLTIVAITAALFAPAALGLLSDERRALLPYFENIIVPEGFCPTLTGSKQPVFPAWVWTALTPLSAFVVLRIAHCPRRITVEASQHALLLGAALALALPSYAYVLFWDEYLLPLIPLAIALTLLWLPTALSRARAIIGLSVMAFFSLALEQEYLAWNSARWRAGAGLMAEGVPLVAIDGGFEWNAWHLYERGIDAVRHLEAAQQDVWAWKRILKPRYEIAFAAHGGKPSIRTVGYRTWLPPRTRAIHVLQLGIK